MGAPAVTFVSLDSRVKFREAALSGELPGVMLKSSW